MRFSDFAIVSDTVEPFISEIRLGDVVDDYCIKCRRLTNHSIVSLMDGKAAKVRCRTCYNDHDYRFEQAPPTKKDLKKAELFKEVLSSLALNAPNVNRASIMSSTGATVEYISVVTAALKPRLRLGLSLIPPTYSSGYGSSSYISS